MVHHTEGHGAGSAVLVAHQFLGVEVVDSLILGRLTAEGETLTQLCKGLLDALAQIAAEDGGLGGCIVCILAGFSGKFHDLALVHDHHALAVSNQDHGAGGDDIVSSLGVGASLARYLLALHDQDIRGDCLATEKFLPLIGQNTAGGTQCSFNKTHNSFLLFIRFGEIPGCLPTVQVFTLHNLLYTKFPPWK